MIQRSTRTPRKLLWTGISGYADVRAKRALGESTSSPAVAAL